MADVAVKETNRGKQGWIFLSLGWLLFLVPIPLLGTIFGGLLVFIAIILAAAQIQKSTGGVGLLATALLGSPIVYLIGTFVLAGALSG